MQIFNKKIVKNIGWNIGGKFLAHGITPLIAILIARILDPSHFGLFAIAAAIISFIDLIKDLGISQVIIIENDDQDLISMQFTVQLIFGVVIYSIIFALSGHIAHYFGNPELKMALIIYALMVFVYCLECPLETFYMKSNKYNALFYRQILPVLFYGGIAYLLALKGFGVLALIIGHLSGRVMTVWFLLVRSTWKPKFYFDLTVFLRLFNLGKHILSQLICGFFVTQADSLIVGKLLGVYNLGFYRMGNILTHLIPNAVLSQTRQVIFSDVARQKNDICYASLRYYQFFYIIGLSAFIFSIAIYFLAPILIPVVLGDKWSQTIPLAKIFSVILPTGMVVGLNSDYSKILGFNRVYTMFSVIRAVATLILVYIGSLVSLNLVVTLVAVSSLFDNVVNEIVFFSNQKIVKYKNTKLIFFIFAWLWAAYVIITNYIAL
jgi:teichuronic acid exporter